MCVDCMWQSVAWCLPGIPSEHLLRNVFLTLLSRNPVFPTQEKTGGVTHVYEISDHTHPLNSKNPSGVWRCVVVCGGGVVVCGGGVVGCGGCVVGFFLAHILDH